MRYTLPADCPKKCTTLRRDYQKEKGLNLTQSPSWFGRPTFLGGPDVISRNKQILFLEKIQIILNAYMKEHKSKPTEEQFISTLNASRILVAACLYIQSQVSRPKNNSVLYRLINTNLGITEENYLDGDDELTCYFAVNQLKSILTEKSSCLGLKPITPPEWDAFFSFVKQKIEDRKQSNPDYPITSVTEPLFKAVGAYSGATVGVIVGDALTKSTTSMPVQYKLTTIIGSTMLVLGSAGPAGVAFIAPSAAAMVINTFCKISLAHLMSKSMGFLGQGIGKGIGFSLDVTCNTLINACNLIFHIVKKKSPSTITGIRITDGAVLVNGAILQLTPVNETTTTKLKVINIEETQNPSQISELVTKLIQESSKKETNEETAEETSSTAMSMGSHA